MQLKSTKHYLAATELLMNSGEWVWQLAGVLHMCNGVCVCVCVVARLERELSSVEALKELKSELMQQKEVGMPQDPTPLDLAAL